MSKENEIKKELKKEEFAEDLTPDDLDIREENDLTKEQSNNTNEVRQDDKTQSY